MGSETWRGGGGAGPQASGAGRGRIDHARAGPTRADRTSSAPWMPRSTSSTRPSKPAAIRAKLRPDARDTGSLRLSPAGASLPCSGQAEGPLSDPRTGDALSWQRPRGPWATILGRSQRRQTALARYCGGRERGGRRAGACGCAGRWCGRWADTGESRTWLRRGEGAGQTSNMRQEGMAARAARSPDSGPRSARTDCSIAESI